VCVCVRACVRACHRSDPAGLAHGDARSRLHAWIAFEFVPKD
jgi:hypothetical protein